ncbi:MAG: CotH kinase family protein, partial [Melioribacteraceae bacterium]|nr:CotH kinase family protein [Melioribacteraceae bacterium]
MDRQLGIYRNTYKEREIPISMEYFPLNSNRAFSIDAGAKIGGENIYRFAQKPLNIYARSNYGYPHIDYKIFDSQPFSEYKRLYLRNGGDDWPKTMMRDGMLGNVLRGKISNSTQAFKPAVLYLNGDYWGIYNLREKIDEQYFFLHYNTNPQNLDHLESDNKIISGDSTDFVNLLSFADANNLADPENYSYVKSRIDVFNLMDFVIVQDYLANSSWGHNREVWRDTKNNNLWRWILVDMDRGFNLSRISTNQLDDIYNNFGLFRNLCNNANFRNEFIQRYSYHINHTFNDDRVQNIIDSLKLLIEPEMPRHIQKWGTYIDSLTIDIWGQTSGISSITAWNSEIEMLKNFASQRSNYAVQYLNDKFNINGRANLKITTNISNEGKIYVNDYLQKFDDNNLYFKDVPLRIKAYPPPGYALKHWKEIIVSNSINIVPSGSQWKYWDGSSSPSNSWTNTNYVDDTWKMGNAQLGYGDGDENTVIDFGPNSQNKFITSYYRKSFQITDLSAITGLKINLLRDDGAIVYLNGIEIIRSNMPVGLINYSTLALSAVSNSDESAYYEFTIDKSNLVSGTNIIAVEVHQSSATSSDISFDLTLQANLTQQAPVENIVSLEDSIEYTIIDDTELIAEFEKISLSTIPASISGELNLTLANSPYFVGEDVIIQQSGILSAEPGVIIYFAKDKNIYTYGQLLIKGSLTQPITLTSFYPSETWGALCFANSIAESKLRHVNISRASHGNDSVSFFASVSSLNSTVRLSNVNFNNVTLPISSQYSNMIIDSCYFDNVTLVGDYINCNGGNITVTNSIFKGNNLEDMDAIDLGFMNAETNIHNNTFLDFTGVNSDGIDIGDACNNVSIKNNLIMNCADKGVSIGQGSTAFLYRNSITGCNLGVGIKDSLSYAEILNCTFFENYIGVACFIKHENRGGGSADIINTIIANSTESSFTTDISSNINISYSISNTNLLPGVQNIYDDPLMVNPKGNNLYLQVKSPCRDNGDPNSPVDEDGTRSDIGAFVFAGESFPLVVLNEINYNSSVMFDSDDWIEIYNNSNVPQDISGWVFISENLAPSFVFRSKTILDADSYLVLCHNLTLFKTKFPGVTNCLGDIISGLSG